MAINKIDKLIRRTDFEVIILIVYAIFLVFAFFKSGLIGVWYAHIAGAIIFSIVYFGIDFFKFLFAPFLIISNLINNYLANRYIRRFDNDINAEVVVILGRYDWFKFDAWMRHNFLKKEIEYLVKLLQAKNQKFSFFRNASREDVEKIMLDKNIREVYFFGHGDSHGFLLNTDEYLYYCDFNDSQKYGKSFVHQVHCGTPEGKSLVQFVVPKENHEACFFFSESINYYDIKREFEKRITEAKGA